MRLSSASGRGSRAVSILLSAPAAAQSIGVVAAFIFRVLSVP